MYIPSDEVREVRERENCSIPTAVEIVTKRKLRSIISSATEISDIIPALLKIVDML